MKKEELVAMGLSDEQASKVVTAWDTEIKDLVPKTRLDDVIKERDTAKADVVARDKQIEGLKKDPEATETLKATIKTLQDTNKTAAADAAKELDTFKRQAAVKLAIAADAQDADIVAGLYSIQARLYSMTRAMLPQGLKSRRSSL